MPDLVKAQIRATASYQLKTISLSLPGDTRVITLGIEDAKELVEWMSSTIEMLETSLTPTQTVVQHLQDEGYHISYKEVLDLIRMDLVSRCGYTNDMIYYLAPEQVDHLKRLIEERAHG